MICIASKMKYIQVGNSFPRPSDPPKKIKGFYKIRQPPPVMLEAVSRI